MRAGVGFDTCTCDDDRCPCSHAGPCTNPAVTTASIKLKLVGAGIRMRMCRECAEWWATNPYAEAEFNTQGSAVRHA